jgi:FlaA1/EpsC-like NDP-sugar epimerase
MTNAKGGEILVRKAPACTVKALAETMRLKYSPQREQHPIVVTGIRPGEKIHEILVNEYEMQRITESDNYFTIHPEYCTPQKTTPKKLGEEYTSENTDQLTEFSEIGNLLELIGKVDMYI